MNADTSKLGFCTTVFFAGNPLAMLTTTQIAERLAVDRLHVPAALRYCVEKKLLVKKKSREHRVGRRENVYGAGPALLAMIAVNAAELPAEICNPEAT